MGGRPFFGDALEGVGDVVGVKLAAILAGEEKSGVPPGAVCGGALGVLPLSPSAEDLDGGGVQGDGAFAAVGLGLADLGGPAELDHLLGDPQVPRVEVDVRPQNAHDLAAA